MSSFDPQQKILRSANRLVDEVVTALLASEIETFDHQQVQETLESMQHELMELSAQIGGDHLDLVGAEELLWIGSTPLPTASLSARPLLDALAAKDRVGLRLGVQATKGEIAAGLRQLRSAESAADTPGVGLLESASEPVGGKRLSDPARLYQRGVALLQDLAVRVARGRPLHLERTRGFCEELLEHMTSDAEPLVSLARYEQDDAFTLGHPIRVAVLALGLGGHLCDDFELLVTLAQAALLHDLGKALLPLDYHLSRAELSHAELSQLSMHAELGAHLLMDQGADPIVVEAAFGHHRSADGRSGYPSTVHEHKPSAVTEIVKIADVYEALTANRPHRRGMTPIQAFRVMFSMGDGRHFDRRYLRHFVEVLGAFPIGQRLQLADGTPVRVVGQTDSLSQPQVVELDGGASFDLRNEPDNRQVARVEEIDPAASELLLLA